MCRKLISVLRRSNTFHPLVSRILISIIMAIGWNWPMKSTTSFPLAVTTALSPFWCALSIIILAKVGSSSTINSTPSSDLISILSSSNSLTKNNSISDLCLEDRAKDLTPFFKPCWFSSDSTCWLCAGIKLRGKNNVNLLPSFVSLSNSMIPPNKSERPRLMDNPKPVPPYFLLVEPSACWNASKMTLCFSFEIPIPVSEISKAITVSAVSRLLFLVLQFLFALYILNFTLPFSVNLNELDNKFLIIWFNRWESVSINLGRFSSASMLNFKCFASDICLNVDSTYLLIASKSMNL